jgi:hypothetical protein
VVVVVGGTVVVVVGGTVVEVVVVVGAIVVVVVVVVGATVVVVVGAIVVEVVVLAVTSAAVPLHPASAASRTTIAVPAIARGTRGDEVDFAGGVGMSVVGNFGLNRWPILPTGCRAKRSCSASIRYP